MSTTKAITNRSVETAAAPVVSSLSMRPKMFTAATWVFSGMLPVIRLVAPYSAMAAGTALAFARAVSEFGATVLISGNLPFKTQVASVHIFNQLESDNVTGAAAVSTVLLVVSLIVLVSLDLLQRWGARRG